jgi:hypothetical protein
MTDSAAARGEGPPQKDIEMTVWAFLVNKQRIEGLPRFPRAFARSMRAFMALYYTPTHDGGSATIDGKTIQGDPTYRRHDVLEAFQRCPEYGKQAWRHLRPEYRLHAEVYGDAPDARVRMHTVK